MMNLKGIAIERLFRPHYPKMSSTKSFTGHTLGASGGVEAVFSALSVKHNYIYPNLRLQTPIKEFPFAAEKKFMKRCACAQCAFQFVWLWRQLFFPYFFKGVR